MTTARREGAFGDFHDLFENAPCGYLVMGADGKIERANATLSRWLGVPADTIVGKRLRDLLTVPGRIFYETNVAPLLRLQDGFEELALDLVTSTGVASPMLVNASVVGGADQDPVSIRVAFFRARERRGYERDLKGREAQAIQRLDDERSASELREQFIAVLGHDLRNPLASIIGGATLLRRQGVPEPTARLLSLMEASADRMSRLIDDVLDFARGRLGGGIGISREVSPLEPLLRHTVEEMQVALPERAIALDLRLTETVSFDKSRLAQLVSNLLGNALTHGDPEQPVRLMASTRDGHLELTVANGGKPIPPAAMERLFHPFFRGEVRASQQGLGLGLHIASEIAKAHGGALFVSSDEAETRFTLLMPVK